MSAEAWIALAALIVTLLGALLGSSFALIWKVAQVVNSIDAVNDSLAKLGTADQGHVEEQKKLWGAHRQTEKRVDRHHTRISRLEDHNKLGPMTFEA